MTRDRHIFYKFKGKKTKKKQNKKKTNWKMVFQIYGFHNTHHSNLVCQHCISTSPKRFHKVIQKLITRNGMMLANETPIEQV